MKLLCKRSANLRGLMLMLLLMLFVPSATYSHSQQPADAAPARANLVPVEWPDLNRLEPEVREQLTSLQSSLEAMAKKPGTSNGALSEAFGTMGEVYQAYALKSAARQSFLNANRLAPADFRWVYFLAKLDQKDDLAEDAIKRLQQARLMRPEYLAVPVNLGNLYLQLNRLPEAEENFKTALTLDPNAAAAIYGLGQIALAQRNYSSAAQYFEKALALVPGANRIHYSLAMAYRGEGKAEQATEELSKRGTVGVRVNDPLMDSLEELVKGERLHLIRGKLALEAKRYGEAAEEFRKAIAGNKDSIEARISLGSILVSGGDLKGGADQFAAVLGIDQQNPNAHYNLAYVSASQNNHNAAIDHLRVVLSINPDDLSARFFLAQEFLKVEKPDEALAEFSRIVAADPNNEEALLEQVKLLEQKNLYKQALDCLEQGHALYPDKGQTAVMLAHLLAAAPQYELRDGARAFRLAQLVYEASGSLTHGTIVAMSLAELGRCDEAAAWQRKLITAAEQQGKTELLAKLKAELVHYEQTTSCRPPGQTAR